MKQGTGSPPTLRPGQRLKQGDVAGINRFVPQEIKGGRGAGGTQVVIRSVGNRHIVQVNQRKGGRGGAGGVTWLGDVAALPAVPSASGAYVCKWLASGTGDDQLWWANGGDTEWTSGQYLTSASGTP